MTAATREPTTTTPAMIGWHRPFGSRKWLAVVRQPSFGTASDAMRDLLARWPGSSVILPEGQQPAARRGKRESRK